MISLLFLSSLLSDQQRVRIAFKEFREIRHCPAGVAQFLQSLSQIRGDGGISTKQTGDVLDGYSQVGKRFPCITQSVSGTVSERINAAIDSFEQCSRLVQRPVQ